MEFINALFGSCNTVQKPGISTNMDEEPASEIQLNAFEFRNYRSSLEPAQQKLVERVVNTWCIMLVKGKTLKVHDEKSIPEPVKVKLDADLLNLECRRIEYPLNSMVKMNMFKDYEVEDVYGLEITFEGQPDDSTLTIHFAEERQRLNFALTLRILRTRDPTLDQQQTVEVTMEDEEDEDEKPSFGKVVNTQHYNIEAGITIVFSVSDLKLFQKIQSSSRHVYLEFFVRYPRQDRFLYAKSPTTHIPQHVLQAEDSNLRRKKEKKDEAEEEEERKKEETKRQVLGQEIPICAMKFDLKNVKMKVPKIPHTMFGRLMAKDDYFPTAIGTFDFDVTRNMLKDMRKKDDDPSKRKDGKSGNISEPKTLPIAMMSSWKMSTKDSKEEKFVKLGALTIRIIGYVQEYKPWGDHGSPASDDHTSPRSTPAESGKKAAGKASPKKGDEIEQEDEEEEGDGEEEEDPDSEEGSGGGED